MKTFLVYMSDCVDEALDYVESHAFARSVFKFKPIPTLKDITVKTE